MVLETSFSVYKLEVLRDDNSTSRDRERKRRRHQLALSHSCEPSILKVPLSNLEELWRCLLCAVLVMVFCVPSSYFCWF